jgi:hypothetical protein
MLFPKEAQAACHRQRRDRRENRTARVGVNNFKEMLDRPSHNIASQIFLAAPAPLRNFCLIRHKPWKRCWDLVRVLMEYWLAADLTFGKYGTQILLNCSRSSEEIHVSAIPLIDVAQLVVGSTE